MENEKQFSPSWGLLAAIHSMDTGSLTEIWEELTAENVDEFLDLISSELEDRKAD